MDYDIKTREDVTRILGEDADDVIRAHVADADRVNVVRWAIEDFRLGGSSVFFDRCPNDPGGLRSRVAINVACRKMAAMALVNLSCRNGGGQMAEVASEAITTFLYEATETTNAEVQHHCVVSSMSLVLIDGVSDEIVSQVARIARCLTLVSIYPHGREQFASLMKGPIGRRIGDLGRSIV